MQPIETQIARPSSAWLVRLAAAAAVIAIAAGLVFHHHVEQRWWAEERRAFEAEMVNTRAFITDSQGRAAEAETLLLRAIDVAPTVPRYWRDLGDYYTKHGHPERAIPYYSKTLELDPSDEETARRLRSLESGTSSTAVTEPGKSGEF